MTRYSFSFPCPEEAFRISDDIFGLIIDTVKVDVAERQRLKIIVSELYKNAYLHGNRTDSTKFIDVCIEIGNDEFVAIVKDEGPGMTGRRFKEVVEPDVDPHATSGRGMRIVYRLSDKVSIFKDDRGKFCVKSVKRLAKKPILAIK